MQNVIGYIRVSTRRQAEENESLDEQAYSVREFCEEKNLKLISIEEDDCTAGGARAHLNRPGLSTALRLAKETKAGLVVPRVDRLARHPAILDEIFESEISVWSVTEGRRVGRKHLVQQIKKAQIQWAGIKRHSLFGACQSKRSGKKLGNRKNLASAQRKGAISNVMRSDCKIRELADFISKATDWNKLTLRKKVNLLNECGPLNLISEARNERRPWTPGSLRKPLKRAEEILKSEAQSDTEII